MRGIAQVLACATVATACLWQSQEHAALYKRKVEPPTPPPPFPPELSTEEGIIVHSITNDTIAAASKYYTHGLHLAGTNVSMAEWTLQKWLTNGFSARLVEYNVYINYPKHQALSLNFANGTTINFDLAEAVLDEDPTTSYTDRVPSFHGYSATGNVTAQFVYVGQGTPNDFQGVADAGIDLRGKIAVVRYGGQLRGLKLKNAQAHGMAGCVLFIDTDDDANRIQLAQQGTYPDGPLRNPTSIERGSVMFLSAYPGDPTTPGRPSTDDVKREVNLTSVLPFIPSLPLSFANAFPVIHALDDNGFRGFELPGDPHLSWLGAMQPYAKYYTGPNPNVTLTIENVMQEKYTPIWDVIGIYNGTESSDDVIIIGNHRDAWLVGGAGDPNSGSAVMVALSESIGYLLQGGWRPRRTIVLASWDMEEYGLVGSTEFVEEYLPWISDAAITYINIDVAVSGPIPQVMAIPELHDLAIDTMKKVVWPHHGSGNVTVNQTLYDVWKWYSGQIGAFGSGSDYTAFVQNGISAIDISAHGGKDDPTFHYHSNFDSYHWMTTFGDPQFEVHVAMAQWLSLLTYHLASDQVIPFKLSTYTEQLQAYSGILNTQVKASKCCNTLNLTVLQDAISTFNSSASAIAGVHHDAIALQNTTLMREVNQKYKYFQRGFISQGGLPGRPFYKHAIFAPGIDLGYAPTIFPGITEAVKIDENVELADAWIKKTARAIETASKVLSGTVGPHVVDGELRFESMDHLTG